MSVADLQRYLGGIGSRNVQQRWREKRELPFYSVAGKILYRKSDIDKFVEKHRITPVATTKIETI
jgi:hypothetical protein